MSDIIVPTIGTIAPVLTTDITPASQLIEDCRALIYAGKRDRINRLAAPGLAATLDDTELALNFEIGFQDGVRLAVDLEELYVWAAEPNIVVQRAVNGSLLGLHTDGAIVYVDPWVSTSEIFRAMNYVLARLSSPRNGIFGVRTVDLTFDPTLRGYDLTGVADILGDPLEVQWRATGTSNDWPLVDDYDVSRSEPTTDFPSGNAIFIRDALVSQQPIRVTYAAPLGRLAGLSDTVVSVTGLRPTALDLLVLGAAVHVTSGKEVARNFTDRQGDTRRAEEVPPNANLSAPGAIRQMFRDRVQEEAAALARDYPRFRRP